MEKPLKRQNFYAKGWKFSPWRDILKPSRKGGVQNENHENQPEQEGHSRTRGWTSPREVGGPNCYAMVAGLEQLIEYIDNLKFSEEDLDYLRSLNQFDEGFLDYLRHFRFTGEIYAMPEGTVAFPYEPLVRVRAPIMEAQFIETALLNIINHQTLIATKASRGRQDPFGIPGLPAAR